MVSVYPTSIVILSRFCKLSKRQNLNVANKNFKFNIIFNANIQGIYIKLLDKSSGIVSVLRIFYKNYQE